MHIKIFNEEGNIYFKDIMNVRDKSLSKGFDFFRFNDIVYFIDRSRNIHKTSIKIKVNI